tara:strand:+ start:336 stop:569 length:234 start_codon:yes stop_codon:yes gene_type:complete
MFENRKYVILNASEVSNIDFNQVLERDVNNLRYNNAGTKTFVKFEGTTPSFLSGKTQYSHSQILTELNKSEWVNLDE